MKLAPSKDGDKNNLPEKVGGWERFIKLAREGSEGVPTPSVTAVAEEKRDPYRVLASTIISLRTKDQVTIEASRRLFSAAPDLASLSELPEEKIAELIYPAGFYRVKAANLHKIGATLKEQGVPSSKEELLALPGVGIKTANLVLGLAFAVPAICVDIHVHRISNRMGIISTKSPEESEKALEAILPREHWIGINTLLVAFGQRVCTPVSPHCSTCPFKSHCPRQGVERSR
jgi:endonuclease-3